MKKYQDWPEAESEFGRLMLAGKISPAEYEAGRQYAAIAALARRVYSTPLLHPAGIDLSRVSGGGYDGDMPREQAQAIKDRHNAAYEACAAVGTRAARVVKDHAILEQPVKGDYALGLLRCGLSALVKHFRIDKRLQIASRAK